jgi:hypothetical protein
MLIGDFDKDCEFLLNEIKQMKLHIAGNRAKFNNGKAPYSCIYGYTKFSKNGGFSYLKKKPSEIKGYFETKLKTKYPHMQEYFNQFSLLYLGNFEFNQVVINRNFKITRHIDSNNIGESYIIGLGNYSGGELIIEYENGDKIIDIKNKPYIFNGSEYYHYVKPFEGERYSLVFYNIKLK